MTQLLLVGIGGFVGSVLRYGIGTLMLRIFPSAFPTGTMVVNVVGCFIIGALGATVDVRPSFNENLRLFLLVGTLGGFTTFSAFGAETLWLAREGHMLRAILNVSIQVGAGLVAVAIGYSLLRNYLS